MVNGYKNIICGFSFLCVVWLLTLRKNKQWFQRWKIIHSASYCASICCLLKNPGKAGCTVGSGRVPIWEDVPELSRAITVEEDINRTVPCTGRGAGASQAEGEKGRLQPKWFLIIFWFTAALGRQGELFRLKTQWSNVIDFHIYFWVMKYDEAGREELSTYDKTRASPSSFIRKEATIWAEDEFDKVRLQDAPVWVGSESTLAPQNSSEGVLTAPFSINVIDI